MNYIFFFLKCRLKNQKRNISIIHTVSQRMSFSRINIEDIHDKYKDNSIYGWKKYYWGAGRRGDFGQNAIDWLRQWIKQGES